MLAAGFAWNGPSCLYRLAVVWRWAFYERTMARPEASDERKHVAFYDVWAAGPLRLERVKPSITEGMRQVGAGVFLQMAHRSAVVQLAPFLWWLRFRRNADRVWMAIGPLRIAGYRNHIRLA